MVFLGRNGKVRDGDRYCIVNDANATAELAARELIALHLASYAYVTWTNSMYWSDLRLSSFKAVLELHGASPSVFDATHFTEGEGDLVYALAEWLKRLELPAGVFAANDTIKRFAGLLHGWTDSGGEAERPYGRRHGNTV